jgi:hypothetical protein
MKTFVLGVLVGAGACFGIIQVTQSQIARDGAPGRSIAGSAIPLPSPSPESSSAIPAASAEMRAAEADRQLDFQPPAADKDSAAAPPAAPSERTTDWIERLSEHEANEVCTRASRLQQARAQAAKDAEPKDAAWAYSMEQLMRQHIEMHLPADKYTKLQLECRTTFCILRMEGKGADARELADKVVQQIQHQDWSDIAQKGSGGGSEGEAWHIHYDWFRPRTESERRGWFWNRPLQRERRP